jgi:hypothetical protein
MDELDRLYRRLVQNVRAGFPELLTRPFEVATVYQKLIPYRLNRRELGFETNEDYELALTQLLSGARAMVMGDDEMQRALRAELESPNPDLSAYRGYATAVISLAPEALRALDAQRALRPAPTAEPQGATGGSATYQAQLAARRTEEVGTSLQGARTKDASGGQPLGARPRHVPIPPSPAATASEAGRGTASECRFCSGQLPEGKPVVFCPHCGHDLTVIHCAACNTELEVGWRFCITCGRRSD